MIAALALLFFGVVFILMMLAVLLERQRVRPFERSLPDAECELSPYVKAVNEEAHRLGFTSEGTFIHAKKGTYRLAGCIWISPDRAILATVFGGSMARVAYRNTKLISRLAEDRCLVTSDEPIVTDLSGMYDPALVLNAGLTELHQEHRRRLETAATPPLPFLAREVLDDMDTIERTRASRLVELGYARFADPLQSEWRFTVIGGLKVFFNGLLMQTARAVQQRSRIHIKRPGGP